MQQDPVADRLRKAPIAPQVRAQVWDLYQQATNEDDLAKALSALTIPDAVKADLWDLKAAAALSTPVMDAPPAAPTPRGTSQRDTLGTVTSAVRSGLTKGAVDTFGTALSGMRTMFPGVRYSPRDAEQLHAATRPENPGEQVGYVAEKATEIALPAKRVAAAGPTTAKAGKAFQEVMGAAKNVPIDVSGPGNVALRIYQLSERGGSMPKAVRDFLRRTTDPEKPPMTYEEARDFASNISRLSADETRRLTPIMRREIGSLRVALNKAVEQAAAKVGKGDQYRGAMRDYRVASRVRDTATDVAKAAGKHAPPIIGAWWVAKTIGDLMRGR